MAAIADAEILDSLTPEQLEALSLRCYDRLPIATIATRMGRSDDSVKKLIRRGLAALRAEGVAYDDGCLQPPALTIGLPTAGFDLKMVG